MPAPAPVSQAGTQAPAGTGAGAVTHTPGHMGAVRTDPGAHTHTHGTLFIYTSVLHTIEDSSIAIISIPQST